MQHLNNLQEHEKICQSRNVVFDSDDDDVIFCGEEERIKEEPAESLQQNSFLQHFQLFKSTPTDDKKPLKPLTPHKRTSQNTSMANSSNNNNTIFGNKNGCVKTLESEKVVKVRRMPRRAPGLNMLLKSQIPITSPAGQRLIAQSNTPITDEYVHERIERYERNCGAPPLAPDGSNRPKFMDKKPIIYNITSFRSNTKHYHYYKFPRRQFSTKRRNDAVTQLERIQLEQTNCKPVHITVQRLSHKEIETLKTQVKVSQAKRRKNIHHRSVRFESEVIDLCSSDAESEGESSEISHGTSKTSSTSTKYSRRPNVVQPTHNTLLFVDCSLPSDHLMNNVETIIDPRLQLTTSRTQYDSTANLLVKQAKPPTKLYTTTHRHRVDYQQIQQDKENRLYSYLSEQSHNPQNTAYLYAEDDLDMGGAIVPASLSTNNLISIDLTL